MSSFLNFHEIDVSLDAALNSEFIYENLFGFSSIGFRIVPPTGGEVAFQGTYDGVNYFNIHLRGIESNLFVSKTTISQNIIGSIASLRAVKFKVTQAGSGPGSIVGRAQIQQSILEGIEDSNSMPSSGGDQAALSVGTTAVEVKVGVSRLEGRKTVTLFNKSAATMYWGYKDTVTAATGTPIYADQFVSWQVTEDVSIFVIAETPGNDARITEVA